VRERPGVLGRGGGDEVVLLPWAEVLHEAPPDARMRVPDGSCRRPGLQGTHEVHGTRRAEPGEQLREVGWVEVPERGSVGCELELVCSGRGEVQVLPVHGLLADVPRQPSQPQATQHRRRTEVDGLDPELVAVAGQEDVGHARQVVTAQVDDLCVHDVPHEQELVRGKLWTAGVGATAGERAHVDPRAEDHRTC